MPTTAATTSAIKVITVTIFCAAFIFPSLAGIRQISSDSQKLLYRLTKNRKRVIMQIKIRYPSISLKINSYGTAGVSIVPGDDEFTVNKRVSPRGLKREKTYRNFDKRIPLLLFNLEHIDAVNIKNRYSDDIEKTRD
jgi:hypothetical protein